MPLTSAISRDDGPSLTDGAPAGTVGPVRRQSLRLLGAFRHALPALLGYFLVRAIGVVVLVLWGHHLGGANSSVLHKLAVDWDAQWYQDIAGRGYMDALPVGGYHNGQPYSTLAFFPLYPALIWSAHAVLPLSLAHSALLVAWVASMAAAWGIFAVGAELYGRRVGVIAAVLWGVLPYAVVESMAYTEPLFTALAVWSLYAVVSRRWVWGGLLSTVACLTRPTGIAVAVALGVAAAVELARRLPLARRWSRAHAEGEDTAAAQVAWWRPVLGAVVAPLGWLGYVSWVGLRKHEWNGYFKVQSAWDSHFDGGKATLNSINRLLTAAEPVWLAEVVVALVLLAYLVLFVVSCVQRQPPVLIVYSAMILLIALGDAAYFNSRARFLLPAVALLLPVATALARVRSRAS